MQVCTISQQVTAEVGSLPGEDYPTHPCWGSQEGAHWGSQLRSPGGGSPLEGGNQAELGSQTGGSRAGAGTAEGSQSGAGAGEGSQSGAGTGEGSRAGAGAAEGRWPGLGAAGLGILQGKGVELPV